MAILILFRDNLPENGVERRKENREMEKKPIFMTSGILGLSHICYIC